MTDSWMLFIGLGPRSLTRTGIRWMATLVLIFQISLIIDAREIDQWQEWSSWSNCSSSCGPGISTRSRQCKRQKQNDHIICSGQRSQHKVCLFQVCPAQHKSSRHFACSHYDGKIFSGRKYSWEPFINPTYPCKLSCRAKGVVFYANFPGLAEDGTPCNTGSSRAVCFQGSCQPVGCDDLIDSRAVRDKCGVCKGNNSTCKTISGIFTSTELRRGMNYVLSIPEGSTDINITELQPSRNVLYLETSTGHTVINGDNSGPAVKDVMPAAGTFFKHFAKSPTNFKESVFSSGPTNESLVLKLNVRDINPGIFYTFNVPNILTDTVLRQISHQTQPEEIPSLIRHRPQPVELSAESDEDDVTSPSRNTFSDLGRRLHLQLGPLSEDKRENFVTDPRTDASTETGHSDVTNTVTTTTNSVKQNDLTDGATLNDQDAVSKQNYEPELNDEWPVDSLVDGNVSVPESVNNITNSLLYTTVVSSHEDPTFRDLDNSANVSMNTSTDSYEVSSMNRDINMSAEQKTSLTMITTTLRTSTDSKPGYIEEIKPTSYDFITNEPKPTQESEKSSSQFMTLEPVEKEISSLIPDRDPGNTTVEPKIIISDRAPGNTTVEPKIIIYDRAPGNTTVEPKIIIYDRAPGNTTVEPKIIIYDRAPGNTTVEPKIIISANSVGESHDIPKISQSFTFNLKQQTERQKNYRHIKDSSLTGSRDLSKNVMNSQSSSPGNGTFPYRRQSKRRHDGSTSREIYDTRRGSRNGLIQQDTQHRTYDRQQRERLQADRQRQLQERQKLLEQRRRRVQEQENQYYKRLQEYNERLKQRRVELERRRNSHASKNSFSVRGNNEHSDRKVQVKTHDTSNLSETRIDSERQNNGNPQVNQRNGRTWIDHRGNNAVDSSKVNYRGNVDHRNKDTNSRNATSAVLNKKETHHGVFDSGHRNGGNNSNGRDLITDTSPSEQSASEQDDIVEGNVVRIKERPRPMGTRLPATTRSSALSGVEISVDKSQEVASSNQIPADYIPSSIEQIPRDIVPNQIYLGSDHSSRSVAYEWRISGLTDCSHTCGGGAQNTIIVCVDILSQAVVTDDNCRHVIKPDVVTLSCNKRPCPAAWIAGQWTQCSTSCGQGEQVRVVTCLTRVSPTLNLTMPPESCEHLLKPATGQVCNIQPCTSWRVGNWTKCSAGCGDGQRSRDVQCVDLNGTVLYDEMCSDLKPLSEERCNLEECGKGWFFSEWLDECPASCGTGEITRHVYCGDEGGNPVPDERCDVHLRPAVNKSCRTNRPCGGAWFTGPWSTCDAVCGAGQKRREVLCIKTFNGGVAAVVGEENCDNTTRPAHVEACQGPTCVSQWYMTSWDQCSQSCGTGHRIREVKCLSGEHKPSDDCSLQVRPRVREHCNTHECSNDTVTQQSSLSQDSSCEDKSDQCVVVKRARLCQYGYYKTECCRSCVDD